MPMTEICSVDAGSPACLAGVQPGETLLRVNGHAIADVLDYKFYTYDPRLTLSLRAANGRERTVKVHKGAGEALGLNFPSYLMDKPRPCANRCIFCFVDQLPSGMRESLYFKDDDARLSFLTGNYITLTNLSERELARIAQLRISPIQISVHATDPALRTMLLGNKNAGRLLERMKELAAARVTMNCQIVACPGLNDGAALTRTMTDLEGLYPWVNSVSVVPVGLTRHRAGLYPLRPYSQSEAASVLDQVEAYAARCLARHGSRIFWCSDELYLRAGRPIPPDEDYEDYAQLENGVGMLRLLRVEFDAALRLAEPVQGVRPYAVACGVDAASWLEEIVDRAAEKCHTKGAVYPVVNHFFGETVTVSGLVTGGDLIAQLQGRDLGARLLLPMNMLRRGEAVFLDDVTLDDVARALEVEVIPVKQDGFDLCDAIFEAESC